jgi:molecular chaperone IbpA
MVASRKDTIMRHFDLSPFNRTTIGFDRLFSLLDQASGAQDTASAPSYPPYNIERTGEHAYRITLAVAGFSDAEIAIEQAANTLTVKGTKEQVSEGGARDILFQGIAARAFERRFHLADYVTVTGAELQHGLLHVDLVREVPEAMKPRTISIGQKEAAKAKPKAITAVAA